MALKSPIRNALAAGHRATAALYDTRLTVRRGALHFTVDAVIGETQWTAEDSDGIVVNLWASTDFIVAAQAYNFGQGPTPPRQADRFEIDGRDGVEVYRLNAPQPEQPWRYSPPRFPDRLRLHTTRQNKAKT